MWRQTPTAVTSPGRVIHQPSSSVSKHHRGTLPRNELACGRNCWTQSNASPNCYLNGDTTEYIKDTCPNSATMTKCGLSASDAGVGGRNLNVPWATRADGTGRYPGLTMDRSAVVSLLQPKPQVRSGNTLRGPNTARDTRQLLQLQGIDYRRGNTCRSTAVNSVTPRNTVPIFASQQDAATADRFGSNIDLCCFDASGSPAAMLRPLDRLGGMPAQTLIHQQQASAKRNTCDNYNWQGNCGEADWADYANVLAGDAAFDLFGVSLAMSPNGKYLAVGEYGDANFTGKLNTYQLKSGMWSATGIITGATIGDGAGYSTGISDDGTRVIVGSPFANSYEGFAKVYEYDGANWNQIGATLYGVDGGGAFTPAANDYSGWAVAISGDGTTVIVGAPGWNSTVGAATLYEWNTGTLAWDRIDTTQTGTLTTFGYAVSVSQDGSDFAIGQPGLNNVTDTSGGANMGEAYSYTNIGGTITQTDIYTNLTVGDGFGLSLALNGPGNTLVIGAPYTTVGGLTNAGTAVVYHKNRAGVWNGRPPAISGDHTNTGAGFRVAIDTTGNRIAIAYPMKLVGGGVQAINGYSRVFKYRSNTWRQFGSDIANDPTTLGNTRIFATQLSGNGNMLVIGRPDTVLGAAIGNVYTYRLETTSEARCCPAIPIRRPVKC